MLSLTALFHGDAGVGKSWLLSTMPGPRLIFDAELRGLYLPGHKVWWDPRGPLPEGITSDTTVLIKVREFADFHLGYQWLASGQHPFNSVGIDSLTELQQRCMDKITGGSAVKRQQDDWGDLLREMDNIVRQLRDLRDHPTKPLWALVIIALSHEKNLKQRPMVQGQLSGKAAGYFDLVGYMSLQLDAQGNESRQALIKPIGAYEAKDNTHLLSQHYGHTIRTPNISEMLGVLNAPPAEVPA